MPQGLTHYTERLVGNRLKHKTGQQPFNSINGEKT